MAIFHFRKLEKWFDTLETSGYKANFGFRCESMTERAQVSFEAYPLNAIDSYDPNQPQLPPVNFTIHAIEPKCFESRFGRNEIFLEHDPINFRTVDPFLWTYETRAEIFCNSPVNCQALFRNVMVRMNGIASSNDIFSHLNPLKSQDPPFWLGSYPASLFCHVRDALEEMNVNMFVPSEPKAVEMPVLLEVGDVVRIVARDFEIDIPEFDTLDAWFPKL
jgi:hypothetical protein